MNRRRRRASDAADGPADAGRTARARPERPGRRGPTRSGSPPGGADPAGSEPAESEPAEPEPTGSGPGGSRPDGSGPTGSGPDESGADEETRGSLVRSLVAILLNVSVLTAIVVYFGWARSERMANLLGIDEAILDMTVDEYARRSLRTVVALPIIAGLAGLMWVAFDQWWRRRLTSSSERDGFVRRSARGVWLAAVVLALVGAIAAWASGTVPAIAAQAFTAAPLLWAGAVLLVLYGVSLRARLSDAVPMPPTTTAVFRGSIAVLVAVGVFWSAANLAWVEGTNLALRFDPRALPGVEVDSTEPLDLLAPGVTAGCLGEGDGLRYRYRGLRLLESTGGRYFLVSDEWTRRYGAVVVLPIESDTTRFTFVRDTEGVRGDGGFGPCEPGAPDAG